MAVGDPAESKNFRLLGHDPKAAWGGGSLVEVKKGFAYVGAVGSSSYDGPEGFTVHDVSDPRKPKCVAEVKAPPGIHMHKVRVVGEDLLYVNAERLKLWIFVGAALLTATVVAFAGPIGFVGLIVPHMLRGLLGSDNRVLVPTALLGGGIFLLAADTVARNILAPTELSVGVITSFCGAPFFVYLLRTRYRRIP